MQFCYQSQRGNNIDFAVFVTTYGEVTSLYCIFRYRLKIDNNNGCCGFLYDIGTANMKRRCIFLLPCKYRQQNLHCSFCYHSVTDNKNQQYSFRRHLSTGEKIDIAVFVIVYRQVIKIGNAFFVTIKRMETEIDVSAFAAV